MLENKIDRIERNVKKVEQEQESIAMSLLKDYKTQNKRLFIIILVVLGLWACTVGYLVYLLNDIEVVETTETSEDYYDVDQDSGDSGNNNFINGNDNEVNNG